MLRRAAVAGHGAKAAGFTLLEVLLAMGLGLVLLLAVYGALDLHWKYSTAGEIEVERAQLARAILQKMALEIRSVVYRKPEERQQEQLSGESGQAPEETAFEISDPADSYTGASAGVFGTSDELVLHISKPVRDAAQFSSADDESAASRKSDLQSISYFLAGAGTSSLGELVEGTGLARLQGDRLELNLASEQGEPQALAEQAKVLAEEVDFLQFRYFDGAEWLEEWDTTAYEALPTAVGITIGFSQPEVTNPLLDRKTASASTESYQLVVALPLARPYEVEAGF